VSISKGSERVKAWIYVVINPWCEAMEIENQLLATGNTTFRWEAGALEYLRVLADHLAGRSARLILEDLVRGEKGLKEFAQVHDDLVRALEKAAREAHRQLDSDHAFQDSVRHLLKSAPSVAPKMDPDTLVKWTAQRVINSGNDVTSRFEDHAFWTHHQKVLLTYREQIPELVKSAGELQQKNEWLLQQLSDVRNQLVEDHDVPPAFVA
jgi:hypothetical protein